MHTDIAEVLIDIEAELRQLRLWDDVPPDPRGLPQIIELEDGRAHLQSGASGRVTVEDSHKLGESLIPRSLNLLLAQQWARAGLMMVHGAAFRYESTGVLALGRQGAGKSTLTAAVLAAGGQVVSDDWLLLGNLPTGGIGAQRLREFLMFRHSAPVSELLNQIPELRVVGTQAGCKRIAPTAEQAECMSSQLPGHIEIDQTWILAKPSSARPQKCVNQNASSANLLAMLVEATMPLLFGNAFPLERGALLTTAKKMVKHLETPTVLTGIELVETPTRTLNKLVGL